MSFIITSSLPDSSISHFVHSFWMLENTTGKDMTSTLLPNGMVDVTLIRMHSENWKTVVRGIDTIPSQVVIPADTKLFSIGLKLLAVEYLLGDSVKEVLNEGKYLEEAFWQFEDHDLNNLENFTKKATQKIESFLAVEIDNRKKKLFDLIYTSQGSITVKELSEKVHWSSRQINRYFHQQFGLSLKAYCNILRFSASLKHISEGKLFPEQDFTDQNHFIKETKKYSGVTPKVLSKNKDNRFIDITAIKKLPS